MNNKSPVPMRNCENVGVGGGDRWKGDRYKENHRSVLWKCLLCIICGIIFGIAVHKTHGK